MTVEESYICSEELLRRALKVIPLGSQTFSKSYISWPRKAAPLFAASGRGSRLIDVDGNEYIDFVNALAAVTIGYADPDVDDAVRKQMEKGVVLSLPHPLELEVAEMIVERIPCAEMVRFGKNGSDATAGAIRAARAITGRDKVAVCGYHGWQDWYIGSTTRNLGVPKNVMELTYKFIYNDLDSLEKILDEHKNEFAAVILEPMNIEWPQPGFLEGVKELTHHHGALLIFDETITGFRYARGGAQEFFGVIPDMATFGKGLANGYPLSAVTGRAEIMEIFEEIFFSFTMGGETLSLAAAKEAMLKADRENAFEHFRVLGQRILDGLQELINYHGCSDLLRVAGHPSWPFLLISEMDSGVKYWEMRTFIIQELISRGIICNLSHNMSLSHTLLDVEKLLESYDIILYMLKNSIKNGSISHMIYGDTIKPIFLVRQT